MNLSPLQLLAATRSPRPPYRAIAAADGTTGLAEDTLSPALLALLQRPQELWHPEGAILKPGSRSTVTRLDLGDESFVIKQYKALRFHRRLRYALTRSRARQSWENGQVMARLGIPVARPLALLEETSLGIPGRSIVLMPFQAGTPLSEKHFPTIADKLHHIFALMRTHHITHGDLKASNILIDQIGDPHFIDLDASLLHSSPASFEKARAKDEARFAKNWDSNPALAQAMAGVFDR